MESEQSVEARTGGPTVEFQASIKSTACLEGKLPLECRN
jgi:hypothetical protein